MIFNIYTVFTPIYEATSNRAQVGRVITDIMNKSLLQILPEVKFTNYVYTQYEIDGKATALGLFKATTLGLYTIYVGPCYFCHSISAETSPQLTGSCWKWI